MAEGILGTKVGMTQVFDEKGNMVPVTVVYIEKCWVVNKRTVEKNGYNSIQVGYGLKEEKKATKPYKGIFKNINNGEIAKELHEFRMENTDNYQIGQELNIEMFKQGEYVDVSSITKGKGFAGTMKRHGFGGLPASHGHTEYRRAPGSLSASSYPSRVFKGTRMTGHMGAVNATSQKLEIVKIDKNENYILIKGAVPGPNKSTLIIKKTVKSLKHKKAVQVQKEAVLKKKR